MRSGIPIAKCIVMRAAFIALILVTLLLSKAQAAAVNCSEVFKTRAFELLPADLELYHDSEIATLSEREIQRKNRELIAKLENYRPPIDVLRAQSARYEDLMRTVELAEKHSVVGVDGQRNYEKTEEKIGYCFGRAAFFHLLLLKMGLQKESILKIWAIGSMKLRDKDIYWSHHVATMAYTKGFGWMVLDRLGKPYTVRHWVQSYQELSTDGRLRFYITESERFSLSFAKYTPVQLGLNLDKETDLYNHYFVDMLKSLRETPLEKWNLRQLPPPSPSEIDAEKRAQTVEPTLWQRLMGIPRT